MLFCSTIAIVVLTLTGIGGAAVVPASQFGQFQIGQTPSSPWCLVASTLANGTPVTIQKCFSTDPQFTAWVSPLGTNGTGPLEIEDNFCLDVTGGSFVAGTKLQIWKCGKGNPNQQWTLNSNSTIESSGKGLCVDLTDGNFVAGQQVQLWTCVKGNTNQIWSPTDFGSFEPGIEPGDLVKFTMESSLPPPSLPLGCIALNGTTKGSSIIFQNCTDNVLNQDFRILNGGGVISLGTGPITVLANSDLCIDVTNGINANGTPLQMWTCGTGNPNQQWRVNAGGTIEWVGMNKCVDLTDGKAIEGTRLQIWECGLTNRNQLWRTAEPN